MMTNKILTAIIESGGNPGRYNSNSTLNKDLDIGGINFQLFLYYLEEMYQIEIEDGDIEYTDDLDYVKRYIEFKTLEIA